MDSVSVFWQARKRALMIPAAEETCWNLMTPAGVTTDLVEAKMLSENSRGRWCGEKLHCNIFPRQRVTEAVRDGRGKRFDLSLTY